MASIYSPLTNSTSALCPSLTIVNTSAAISRA